MYDVIVAGGSYAGMAAALQLVRARRKVLVIDGGQRRNRFAAVSHGVLGHDGRAPDAIHADARAQLLAYPDVTWREGLAVDAAAEEGGFTVRTGDGGALRARRLILATGVSDSLPDVPGLRERWGDSVVPCPYCHGYEFDRGALGVLGAGEVSMHQALLLPEWGETTLFTNGSFEPDADQLRQLEQRGVAIEREAVAEVVGPGAGVRLRDGRTVELDGLFVASRIRVQGGLAEALGCAFAPGPLGDVIRTDDIKQTSVPGVFACGDAARAMASVSLAIGDGALAGIGTHRSLVFEGLH
ncbi:NAD(P)/FAD-dependent oxidoreductase [Massilia forsythiae]|uniref:NAD(P)/FAD-dependent oxidoreductase n=1 Tax=Massilia forsythiae TaxID=2728020 RepID=A0A7Z2VXF5_9BURK|nr:NAD(P)/FAD-dependent oxidoreductase [Massilia forsythiae]QJE00884.1 NAD(P)/FAD-dependent oxidoreductase [Massilia forsythiae]